MKFEHIKVGDTALVETGVSYGFGQSKTFFVSAQVTAVTKTQFTAGNVRAQKKDGSIIGDRWRRVFEPGETTYGKTACDQTKEMIQFTKSLALEREIEKLLFNMKMKFKKNTGKSWLELNMIVTDLNRVANTLRIN